MRLRLDIDQETHDRLLQTALVEKRPIHWQAEVILRRALGLPFPRQDTGSTELIDKVGSAAIGGGKNGS